VRLEAGVHDSHRLTRRGLLCPKHDEGEALPVGLVADRDFGPWTHRRDASSLAVWDRPTCWVPNEHPQIVTWTVPKSLRVHARLWEIRINSVGSAREKNAGSPRPQQFVAGRPPPPVKIAPLNVGQEFLRTATPFPCGSVQGAHHVGRPGVDKDPGRHAEPANPDVFVPSPPARRPVHAIIPRPVDPGRLDRQGLPKPPQVTRTLRSGRWI
jgi:hypothetical protein